MASFDTVIFEEEVADESGDCALWWDCSCNLGLAQGVHCQIVFGAQMLCNIKGTGSCSLLPCFSGPFPHPSSADFCQNSCEGGLASQLPDTCLRLASSGTVGQQRQIRAILQWDYIGKESRVVVLGLLATRMSPWRFGYGSTGQSSWQHKHPS